MPSDLMLQPMPLFTGSADEDGRLVTIGGRLIAVLVRLQDPMHADLVGRWYLEAGFGPCAEATAPTFATLDAAQDWITERFGCGSR